MSLAYDLKSQRVVHASSHVLGRRTLVHQCVAVLVVLVGLIACSPTASPSRSDAIQHDTHDVSVLTSASTRFCQCMLVACHDVFHATWGATDAEAIPRCLIVAATLPREVTAGSGGLPCRLSACQGTPDEAQCERLATLAPCGP